MSRRYFGTDGVRGVVGADLTPELVERRRHAPRRCGRAAGACSSAATRARRGPSSRRRSREGSCPPAAPRFSAACFRPRPSRCSPSDLGVVVSASHNPPEYNGVKFFLRRRQARRRAGGGDRGAVRRIRPGRRLGRARSTTRGSATSRTSSTRFGSDLSGLRIGVDCANGAFSDLAPAAFERCGAEVHAIGVDAGRLEHQRSAAARPTSAPCDDSSSSEGLDLGVAFDGDGDRMLAVDERGEPVDGDQIIAVLALHLGVDLVAVTVMTNLGFHALMAEHGIRVRHDAGRRPLRARGARARGRSPRRRAVGSRHLARRPRDGRRARCRPAPLRRDPRARTLSEAAAVMLALSAGAAERPRQRRASCRAAVARRGRAAERGARRARPRPRAAVGHGAGRFASWPRRKMRRMQRKLCASIAALVERELG